MTCVRFLKGASAGLRCFSAGEVAGIPDLDARRLVAMGAVEIIDDPRKVTKPAAAPITKASKAPKGKLWP